jgi:hypothetical protein
MILIGLWIAAVVVIGGPAGVAAVLFLIAHSQSLKRWRSLLIVPLAAVVGLVAQYAYVVAPVVRSGEYGLTIFTLPLLGPHLLAPLAVAGVIWVSGLGRRSPSAAGIGLGLLLSIPALLVLCVPLTFQLLKMYPSLHFVP